jgi:hypothetical protein
VTARCGFTISGSGRKAPFIAYGPRSFACVVHPKVCTECDGGQIEVCPRHPGMGCDCDTVKADCDYCGGLVEVEEFDCQCDWCSVLVEQVEREGRMVVTTREAAGIR